MTVTNNNVKDYILAEIKQKLLQTDFLKHNLEFIRKGFYSYILKEHQELIRNLNIQELMILLTGT